MSVAEELLHALGSSRNICVTAEERTRNYLSRHQSFQFLQLWIGMRQHKHQVCLLQYKVVWRRADHISLGRWNSNTDFVTVSETVQTEADHGRGPQRVQKHITKRTAILNRSSNKVRISRWTFLVEFLRKLRSLLGITEECKHTYQNKNNF